MGFGKAHWLCFGILNAVSAITNARALQTIKEKIKIDEGFQKLIWLDVMNNTVMAAVVILATFLHVTLDEEATEVVSCSVLWLGATAPNTLGLVLTAVTAAFRLRSLVMARRNMEINQERIISCGYLSTFVVYLYLALIYYNELLEPGKSLMMLSICTDLPFKPRDFINVTVMLTGIPQLVSTTVTIIMDAIIIRKIKQVLPLFEEDEAHQQQTTDIISIPIKSTVWSAMFYFLNLIVFIITVSVFDSSFSQSFVLTSWSFVSNASRAPLTLRWTFKLVQEKDEAKTRLFKRLALQRREVLEAKKSREQRRQAAVKKQILQDLTNLSRTQRPPLVKSHSL